MTCRSSSISNLGTFCALALPLLLGCSSLAHPSGKGNPVRQSRANAGEVRHAVFVEESSPKTQTAWDAAGAALIKFAEFFTEAAQPSNHREWEPDMAQVPWAEWEGNRVFIHNIRNCEYRTPSDYTVRYYDRWFDVDQLERIDLIIVPFLATPSLAHTMLSFGFSDGSFLGLSVEIRREKGEKYMPLWGVMNQFELIYVLGDERDLIAQCTDVHLNGVYLYELRLTPEEEREVFIDVLHRVNKLAQEPEFYNTLTNNCTTNLVKHLNRLDRVRIPINHQVIMPGYLDRLLYNSGLIENDRPFEDVRASARINLEAYLAEKTPDFSLAIRRR